MIAALRTLTREVDSPKVLLALFVVAAAIRAAAAVFTADFGPDVQTWEYGLQGACAAENGYLCLYSPQGEPYVSALMPPLTSYLWFGLYSMFGVGPEARIVYVVLNVLVGAACPLLLLRFSRAAGFPPLPSLIAAGLICFYPTFVLVSGTYHATNYTVALLLAFSIALVKALESGGWRTALVAGVLGGLATLTRNELLLASAGAGVLLLWFGRRDVKRAVIAGAALGIGVFGVMSPWLVRNAVYFERLVPVGNQSGYNLWFAFGPYAQGSGNRLDNDPEARAAAEAIRVAVPPGDAPGDRFEDRTQQAFLEEARQTLEATSLGRLAALTAEKTFFYWVIDWTDPIAQHPVYWGPWAFVMGLAAFGLARLWLDRPRPISAEAGAVIALVLGVMALTFAISTVFLRYRMHVEPYLMMFAGYGAWRLAEILPLRRAASAS